MTTIRAYYNENEPFAAQWLRNLIEEGSIAPGDVDDRDIRDVRPDDLLPYVQVHLFAGIGVWSGGLRAGGWADDQRVWSCSCPCQPFSQGGGKLGFADKRHLWPAAYHLIQELRPPVLVGEQVASKDAEPWIDLVHSDLEAMGYAFGCVPFPSAGVGSPQVRDRSYWAAACGMAHPESSGCAGGARLRYRGSPGKWRLLPPNGSSALGVADAQSNRRGEEREDNGGGRPRDAEEGLAPRPLSSGPVVHAREVNGFWGAADWLLGRDGKWRPVEPRTFPLAHGITNKVGLLRAYGNAVNLEAASAWSQIVREHLQ